MKSVFIILISVICFTNFMVSQTVYNIKDYNGQTIDLRNSSTPCIAIFTSSNTCYNSTCYVNCACSGENYSITFYSGNANKRLALWFAVPITGYCTGISQIFGGDHLYVYDGPNTSSTFMHDLDLTNYSQDSIISSGSYITFIWNSTTSDSYWWAEINCETIPAPPSGCNGNTPASNFCYNSPQICYLNGYCGNTSDYYTADLPGNMCENCSLFLGTIQNNSWISFTADTTIASIQVTVSNCTKGKGIQVGVYSGINCNNFQILSDPGLTSGAVSYINANSTFTINIPFGSAPGLVKGQEYYIMVDGLGGDVCDYSIQALSGIFVVSAGTNQTICSGQSVQMNAKGGNSYNWSPETGLSSTNIANPIASPKVTTTYTVTITGGTTQCPQSSVASVVVFVKTSSDVTMQIQPTTAIISNPLINFNFTSSGISPVIYWLWTLGTATGDTTINDQSFSYKYKEPGTYPVSLITVNQAGCKDSITEYVKIIPENTTIFVPNAFAPDGINRTFNVYGESITDFQIMIFTRWGEKIFESNDIKLGWDGTFNNKLVPAGVYTYRLKYMDEFNQKFIKYGEITLLR